MPNIKSASKRIKTSEKAAERNRVLKGGASTARRKLYEAIAAGDATASTAAYRAYCSVLDKGVKKGVIKANNANRRKSRAAARLATLSA